MIRVGVDYYPEHWDRELWAKDIALMKETGVTTIRIAEFMWGMLEPSEGIFDFSLLDDFIRDAEAAGLELILCTPTNCPPLWMYRKYPDTIQMDRTAHRIATGIRGHRCIESRRFRNFASIIIDQMTLRYADDSHVIGWQIDNELEANHCTCPECTEKWRQWLKTKYTELAAHERGVAALDITEQEVLKCMNRAWGTDIWSGQISDWEQIQGPLGQDYNFGWLNPGYMLDFERYAADSTAGYIRFQVEQLRKRVSADIPITTNACFGKYTMDFVKSFAQTDVVSYDNYPPTSLPADPEAIGSNAATLDLMRGTKRKNFWILEQLSGPFGCWGDMQKTPRPGMIEGYGLQTIAHGADLLLFWRWRAAIKGAETFCQGLIGHDSVPGRRFEEFRNVCRRIGKINEMTLTDKEPSGAADDLTVKAKAAILFGMDQFNALHIQAQSTGYDYWNEIKKWQYAFRSMGVDMDIIDQEAEIRYAGKCHVNGECLDSGASPETSDGYNIIVIPAHFITDPVTVENVRKFAEDGGTVIVTCRSGVKDPYNAAIMQPLPTVFGDLCGIEIAEYDPLGQKSISIDMNGTKYEASLWCDLIKTHGAEPIAIYDGEFYKGTPAITRNEYGKGSVFYVGTCGHKALLKKMAEWTIKEQRIIFAPDLPDGVELCTRENRDGSMKLHFIFNETERENEVRYGGQVFSLMPFEMKIIKEIKEKGYEIF